MEITDYWTGEEWISVEVITKNTGILQEASIDTQYGFKDLVLINPELKEINQVIKKGSNTVFFTYDSSLIERKKNWSQIKSFFLKKQINVQQHEGEICLLSIPLNFNQNDISELLNSCPVSCVQITQESSIDDYDGDDDDDDGLFHLN